MSFSNARRGASTSSKRARLPRLNRIIAPDVLALLLVVGGLLVFDRPPMHTGAPLGAPMRHRAAEPDELTRALARMGDESDELARALARLHAHD